ncbi:unnamed protein product [Oppiella nova]|uniref:TSC22 domain family protein 1 n=1 Tax=Oppiella nova TaxID=334625 RepID=A0A7R9LNG6_9ACAR|nr:unnamed protein product [Oppiella nova]CAG2165385.1 unnamed protein product [Oppiella nova]
METNVATIESDFGEDLSASCLVTSNKENINGSQSSQRHRFKVVKLVSSEPYLRGRWNCKDFISKDGDPTTTVVTTTANEAVISTAQQPTSVAVASQQTSVTTTTTTTTTGGDSSTTPNGVAIDNKIEQAMDLVKSHLMFAVREEVDVLKERIKELESEIHILRAHATSDVLQLVLQQQQPGAPPPVAQPQSQPSGGAPQTERQSE